MLGRAHPKPSGLLPAPMARTHLLCSDLPLAQIPVPSSVTVPEPRPRDGQEMKERETRGCPSSAEAWLRSCSRQGQLLWRREITRQEKQPGNSLALHPHFPQKLSLESGGGRENLESVGPRDKPRVKRGPCAWGAALSSHHHPCPSPPQAAHGIGFSPFPAANPWHRGALNTPHPDCPSCSRNQGTDSSGCSHRNTSISESDGAVCGQERRAGESSSGVSSSPCPAGSLTFRKSRWSGAH